MPWWGWLIRSNYGLSSTAEWTTSFQLMSSSSGQGGPHLWHYNRHTMRINFSYSENNYAVLGPGFGDILQLGSNNSERSYMLKWYRFVCPCVCMCPKRFFLFFFTLFTLHVALVMLVKCKQWWFFFQAFSAFDRWLFGVCSSVVSSSHKWMYWTQTGEAICNTHFNKKKKKVVPGKANFKQCLSFVSETTHSVVWVPFASNITTAKSKKNKNYFWFLYGLPSATILLNSALWVSKAFNHFLSYSQLFFHPISFPLCSQSHSYELASPASPVSKLHQNI